MSNTIVVRTWLFGQVLRVWLHDRLAPGEQGEGVISACIAVLIMAFLGVGLWVAFHTILGNATTSVSKQVSQIGS